jgi:DNA repair protein RecN (Recombination protein N)
MFAGSYLEKTGVSVDPARIDRLNARLAKIQRLKKKYGCTAEGLAAKRDSVKADLDSLANVDADRAELAKKLASALALCRETGKRLGAARTRAAAAFDKKVTSLMVQLGFTGGKWRTELLPHADPSAGGLEEVRFMVQTNPGEPILPLVKTASGGEISRLMLAIKRVMSAHDHIPVLIFDEIDTGIGGVLAGAVGDALAGLAKDHQVLCITHLHQIASLADNHFHVYKEPKDDRTVTLVKKLSDAEKINEITRMLGGESASARRHAKDLLSKHRD